jgi:hypothetical protein
MRRLSAFFLFLMLAMSLGLGSAAHASESVICVATTAAASLDHSISDSDQVPADSGKGYPHHHAGCHGHHIAAPVTADTVATMDVMRVQPFAWDQNRMARAPSDPALRPPQA